MSSPYRRIYPGSNRLMFDGGKNSKFERSIIGDNESPDCKNVVFTNGAVETRQGTTKLNTAAIGSFVGDGLYTRRADDGSETMVAFAGGTAWELTGTSFITIGSAQSVFTAGVRMAATQYENYLFMGNGGTIPYKWNGATFTRHGVYPPSAAVVSTAATGTALNGVYSWKFTNRNSNLVESDLGSAVTATYATENARLSGVPVAPQSWGVNARVVYRTEAGGSTYKRVAVIADNTTTVYEDGVADGSLGVTGPSDNGVPPNYSVCIYHQDRLFVNDPSEPNYVRYSNLGDPYTFPTTNFIRVGDNTSDLVKAFGIYDNSLVIFCERSAHIVYMRTQTASDWSPPVRLRVAYGSKSPHCVLSYSDKLLFGAMQADKFVGFGAISGDSTEPSATLLTVSVVGSDLKTERIETDMFNVVETYVPNTSGIVYKNKAYITLTYDSGSTTNNRIYVMDFSMSNLGKQQKESWVPWTGLNAAQFTIYSGNLYYISSTATGFVYKMEAGVYSDDGSAIDSYFWTKEFAGQKDEVNAQKDFRYANILLEKAGDFYMDVAYRVDSDKGSGTNQQINLDPGSSLWGSMVWGRDLWGGGSDQEENRLYLGGARGKRIQFKFSNQNTAGSRFKVHGMNFHYNLKGYR